MRVAWPILCCWLLYFSWCVPLDRSSVAAEECSVSSVMVEGLSGEVRTSPSPSSPDDAVGLKTFFCLIHFFCLKLSFASNIFLPQTFFASKFFGLKHEKMSQKFSPSVSVSTDLKTSQGSPKLSRLSEDEWSQIFDNQFVSNWTSYRC